MKIKLFKNGAYTTFEKNMHGYYIVQLRDPSGNLYDKVMCDDYRDARDYLKSFNGIAKNKWS